MPEKPASDTEFSTEPRPTLIVPTDLLYHVHNFPPENKILIKSLPLGLSGCWGGLVVGSGSVPVSHLWAGDTSLVSVLPGSVTHSPVNGKRPCISPWKLHQQSQTHSMHKGDPVNTLECGNGEEPLVQGWGEAGASAEFWLMPGAGAWLTWPWLMTSCVCLSHRALCLTSLGCEDKHLPSWATLWSPRLGRNGSEILRRKQSHRCEVSLPVAIKGFYHFLLLSSTWAEHKVTLVLF